MGQNRNGYRGFCCVSENGLSEGQKRNDEVYLCREVHALGVSLADILLAAA